MMEVVIEKDLEENKESSIIHIYNEYKDCTEMTIKSQYKDCKELLSSIYCGEDSGLIRKDIQILRALAVILVFFYHLGLNKWFFGAGFIGVDIFFVISGYLVVGSLIKEEREKKFNFINFISRRIKRLFIPSVICLCFIIICSLIFQLYTRIYKDIFAASLHYINYYFVNGENDYFKTVSTESIVLHYWSLAVEEQFYLFLPIVFGLYKICFCNSVKIWKNVYIFLTILFSISLLSTVFLPPNEKFFFMFSRIWEFMAGVIVFEFENTINDHLTTIIPHYSKICLFIQIICLFILTGLSIVLPGNLWPNAYTLVVIMISSLFILCKPSIHFKPFEMVGDWSYSIYLYHYPIIKIVNLFNYSMIGTSTILIVLFTSISSLFSYYCIEKVHKINKWSPSIWISFYIIISLFIAFNCSYFDLKQELKLNPNSIIINSSCLEYEPFDKYNQTLFEQSIEPCLFTYTNHQKYFWGPGYHYPSNETFDPAIEIQGRNEFCILLLGNSRSRHYAPLIKLFVKLTNATFIDGCTHAKRSNTIPKECKNIITFIGEDAQYAEDQFYFPTLGCTIVFTSAPAWFLLYPEREKDVLACLKENATNITNCNVPWKSDYIRVDYPVQIRENFHLIDFTDDFCYNGICHLNIGNELVTVDAWHLCSGAVMKLWPKFLSFMNGLECGRKFIKNQ